ncbi:aldo/keto reductase [Actinokineospora diospyrosa]|uniref:Oxidoreductase n=1 Tax=Actinokineospora diospyrosa TaxID=103728 RepID=A0ABT1IIY5_9PSEU|nr:aldo/keto reductase [Actinokineospora diospyrosa]MCP2272606.1 putative oxidoreductase [Actinokineospora diospyrosa]
MRTKFLGRSGLQVSELSFGAMTFGGSHGYQHIGQVRGAEAKAVVARCVEAGINLFDTADVYSGGRSEEVLGEALRGLRDEVLVATKVRWAVAGNAGPNDQGLSRHHIVRSVEASLRRLGTDHIDLYQVHGWDGRTPWEETLRALDDLVRAGKVRYLGASNLAAWQLTRALGISELHRLERFVGHQIQYNLVSREAEWDLLPMAEESGVGITCWSPLAGGLLTGHQPPGQTPPAGTRRAVGYFEPHDTNRAFDTVSVLRKIADNRGVTPAQVAIRWLLEQPGVSSVILGARDLAQLADNLAATTWSLDDTERADLDLVSYSPPPYPHWHQMSTNAARVESPGGLDN